VKKCRWWRCQSYAEGAESYCEPRCRTAAWDAEHPRVRDQRYRGTAGDVPMWRRLLRDLEAHPYGLDTGWFCARYGSSWRTRISDLRLWLLDQRPPRTIVTLPIAGSACKRYKLEEV